MRFPSWTCTPTSCPSTPQEQGTRTDEPAANKAPSDAEPRQKSRAVKGEGAPRGERPDGTERGADAGAQDAKPRPEKSKKLPAGAENQAAAKPDSAEQGEPKRKPKPKGKAKKDAADAAGKDGAASPAREPKKGGRAKPAARDEKLESNASAEDPEKTDSDAASAEKGAKKDAGKPGSKGATGPPAIVPDDGRTKIRKVKPKTKAELSRELLLDIRDNRVRLARIEALIKVFLEQGRIDRFHYLEDLREREVARFERSRDYYREELGDERFFKQLAVASGDDSIAAAEREATEFRKKLEAEALRQEEARKKAANRDRAERHRELEELLGTRNRSKSARGKKIAQLKIAQQRAAKKKAAQEKAQKQRAARAKAAQQKADKKRAAKKRVAQQRAAKKRAAEREAQNKVAREEGDGSEAAAPEGKQPARKKSKPEANEGGGAQQKPVPASTGKTADPKKGGAGGADDTPDARIPPGNE